MSDILVQNALVDLKELISASSISTGDNLDELVSGTLKDHVKGIIDGNTGPYGSSASGYLCDLSQLNKISSCNCNYSGSGTSSTSTTNTNNPWTDGSILTSSATQSASTIADFIIALSDELTSYKNIGSTQLSQARFDVYSIYLNLQTTEYSSNTSVLGEWYNQGAAGPGKPISTTNLLKVCNTTWKYGYGPTTCTWTVPTGATRAKFQVWGAGKGSNPGCCCGGSSFGQNGAYAELVMDVTAGDSYTVCAGCSCSRYCCSNSEPGNGCASGVTGPGICCLIGQGAHCALDNCNNLNTVRLYVDGAPGSGCRRFQNPYCTSSGPCWCSQGEYCYDSSCATCGVVPVYPDQCCQHTVGCSCACSDRNAVHGATYTIRGIHGGGCLDTSNYGYHIRPPIIDADTGNQFSTVNGSSTGCYCQAFTSNCCCGGCNGKDWITHPGHGGAGTHTMGGNNTHKGDTGRAGLVQISWT